MMGRVLAADLDANVGRVAVQVGDQNLADKLIEMHVFLGDGFQAGGKRPHDAISQEHPQKRSDQSRADHLPQNFRRLVQRAHGFDHAQNGRDDAEGGQGVGHGLHGVAGMHRVVLGGLHPLVQHLLDLMGVIVVQRCRAQGVADQVHRLMVMRDLGVAREDR